MMEAVINHSYYPADLPPEEVIALFFRSYSREDMREHAFHLFKCWVSNSCELKENIPNKELALFLDQLIDIKRYENGEINMTFLTIIELAKGLDVELKDLMDY